MMSASAMPRRRAKGCWCAGSRPVMIAMLVMLASASPIGGFVERHPSVKILALSFLLLIGVMLVAEGMGSHMEKGYIYVAMAFSLFVELLNLRYRAQRQRAGGAQRLAD